MKAYRIYIDGHCPVGLSHLRKSEALGAMALAR